jgi:peptide/nickel transport system permease protein
MTQEPLVALEPSGGCDAEIDIPIPPRISEWRRFRKVFFGRKVVVFGLVVVVGFVLMAIFAPLVAPYDPYEQTLSEIRQGPSLHHLLGTDSVGRDTLSRIIYGSRTSLIVGGVAIALAAFVGMAFGLIAGYFGGPLDMVVMRTVDALMAIPMILLALTISAVLGPGLQNVVIAIGVAEIPPFARLMRGQVLSEKNKDYVTCSRAIGSTSWRTMRLHVVPNCFPPLIVLMTQWVGMAILAEAGLSFLGVGLLPPTASWGGMVSEGYRYLLSNPILSVAPGCFIILIVFALNTLGDGLRDAMDPALRGVL